MTRRPPGMDRPSLALMLYTLGGWLVLPVVIAHLLWRARLQPEYRQHWRERWAWYPSHASYAPNSAPLIWLHAVSVGETRAAQPLVTALRARHPGIRILLTAMTPTGRSTARELFGDTVMQAYLPYDHPGAMRRFLAHWQPCLGLVIETELWPHLVSQARLAGVPIALVNARLSERSLRRGRRWHALIGPALAGLDRVIAQTPQDAQRLQGLGRADAAVAGNLKFDVTPPQATVALGRRWRHAMGGRQVLLCASTRDGEEAVLLDAWKALPDACRERLMLVVVPRHPQRFDAVAELIRQRSFSIARRSTLALENEASAAEALRHVEVLLGDSMGEMFAWYAVADVAIMGGSLLPFGAQNLIEACTVGTPVVLGPHTYNFAQAAQASIEAGAAIRVQDAAEAIESAAALLQDPQRRTSMSEAARTFAQTHRGATERTLALLDPWLARLRRGDS